MVFDSHTVRRVTQSLTSINLVAAPCPHEGAIGLNSERQTPRRWPQNGSPQEPSPNTRGARASV